MDANELLLTAARATAVYVLLLIVIRALGRRTIGNISAFDLLVALMLILVRGSGKRTIRQGELSSFIVALVIGDLFDDLFWAEVPAAQFIVAVGTLVTLHTIARTGVAASGTRDWLRAAR